MLEEKARIYVRGKGQGLCQRKRPGFMSEKKARVYVRGKGQGLCQRKWPGFMSDEMAMLYVRGKRPSYICQKEKDVLINSGCMHVCPLRDICVTNVI